MKNDSHGPLVSGSCIFKTKWHIDLAIAIETIQKEDMSGQ